MENDLSKTFEFLAKVKSMNRKQKRAFAKEMHIPYSKLIEYTTFEIADMNLDEIPANSKVKIKYDRIIEQKEHLTPNFLTWVEENKNKTFTFEPYGDNPNGTRGTFEEDTTEPKWIFSATDLIFDLSQEDIL